MEFAKIALDENSKTFVVYVAVLEVSSWSIKMVIYPSKAAQIIGDKPVQVVTL